MNVNELKITPDADNAPVRRRLESMAELPIDEALWQRIEAQAWRQRWKGILRTTVWPAIAASVVLAVVVLNPLSRTHETESIHALIVQSQMLELQLRDARDGEMRVVGGSDFTALLSFVDGQINRAYGQGASTQKLQTLWSKRINLLEQSLQGSKLKKIQVRI